MKKKYLNPLKRLLPFLLIGIIFSNFTSCKGCETNKEPNFRVNFQSSIRDSIPAFTKIYAQGAKTDPIIISNVASLYTTVLELPIDISSEKTVYIFEIGNLQKRLSIGYTLKPLYESDRCGFRFALENTQIIAEETDFSSKQVDVFVMNNINTPSRRYRSPSFNISFYFR